MSVSVRVGAVGSGEVHSAFSHPPPALEASLPPCSSPDSCGETPAHSPLSRSAWFSVRGLEGAGSPHICTETSPSALASGQSHCDLSQNPVLNMRPTWLPR